MNINIHNMRHRQFDKNCPYHVRVDRLTPLGNPYVMHSEADRKEACSNYKLWFEEELKNPSPLFHSELKRILAIYKQYGQVDLFCWCFPSCCHAETIRDYIIRISEMED